MIIMRMKKRMMKKPLIRLTIDVSKPALINKLDLG